MFLVELDRRDTDSQHFHRTISFTGGAYISVFFRTEDRPGSITEAHVQSPPDSMSDGFELMSPHAQASLFDTKKFGRPQPWFDLVHRLESTPDLFVFEKLEHLDGHRCLVLANSSCKILLDIEKDFSLVQQTCYIGKLEHSQEGAPKLVGPFLDSQRTLSDLTDYGNGIWLPKKSDTIHFADNGTVRMRDSVVYVDTLVNSGVESSFFEEVIPEDALVHDTIRGMSYKQSDRASINALLKETAKSKRVWTLQIISITAGTILIITALIIKYLAYRKMQ